MIDLTITAQKDGSDEADGMPLGELERTCARLRANGGTDATQLDVRTNRAHRIRKVTAIGLDDGQHPIPAAATPDAGLSTDGDQ
jgi:hypothetical protein